ncbi:hypothetical protein [Orrella sp. 11846]|uniref:hypothetical protein n=1 Tax=Orrella sp. 11846 TaxID=3409913 RepID=UPI003B5AC907
MKNKQTLGDIVKDKASLERTFFSKKQTSCFECKTPINDKTRRRIVVVEYNPQTHLGLVGYQVCSPCAEKLLAKQMHKLKTIPKDMAQANVLSLGGTVGGVQ